MNNTENEKYIEPNDCFQFPIHVTEGWDRPLDSKEAETWGWYVDVYVA